MYYYILRFHPVLQFHRSKLTVFSSDVSFHLHFSSFPKILPGTPEILCIQIFVRFVLGKKYRTIMTLTKTKKRMSTMMRIQSQPLSVHRYYSGTTMMALTYFIIDGVGGLVCNNFRCYHSSSNSISRSRTTKTTTKYNDNTKQHHYQDDNHHRCHYNHGFIQNHIPILQIRRMFATAASAPMSTTSYHNKLNRNNNKIPFYGLPRVVEDDDVEFNIPNNNNRMRNDNSNIPQLLLFERISLTIENAIIALRNPERADAVAIVGELTGHVALQQLYQVMLQHPIGMQILNDRPIISKLTIPYQQLIDNVPNNITFHDIMYNNIDNNNSNITFGQAYGLFLKTYGFDPDERNDLKYLSQEDELGYIMLRYRQCHDFYHVLTGIPPTVVGELGLKWFELYQTHLPLSTLSVTFGSLSLSNNERYILYTHYLPWAQHITKNIPYGTILNIYYEKEWDTPLTELRNKYNIIPPKTLPSS